MITDDEGGETVIEESQLTVQPYNSTVSVRASNEDSRRFHNHGEGPE